MATSNSLQAAAGETTPRAKSVVFVFLWGGPSHLDTFDPKPDAPLEYRGPLATIATRHAGIPEVVTHDENGWLVEESAPEQLARQMLWCARTPRALETAGVAARRFVESNYALDIRMERLDDKYGELIECRRPAERPREALPAAAS